MVVRYSVWKGSKIALRLGLTVGISGVNQVLLRWEQLFIRRQSLRRASKRRLCYSVLFKGHGEGVCCIVGAF